MRERIFEKIWIQFEEFFRYQAKQEIKMIPMEYIPTLNPNLKTEYTVCFYEIVERDIKFVRSTRSLSSFIPIKLHGKLKINLFFYQFYAKDKTREDFTDEINRVMAFLNETHLMDNLMIRKLKFNEVPKPRGKNPVGRFASSMTLTAFLDSFQVDGMEEDEIQYELDFEDWNKIDINKDDRNSS